MPLRSLLLAVPLLALVGCGSSPTVTKGTFTRMFTLTMQRGSVDIVVRTDSTGTYVITNYSMDHPMGQRPDTEATFTTPAGTFAITDKGVPDGLLINGKAYPNRGSGSAVHRLSIAIDESGTITVTDPTPPEEKPKAKE